MGDYEGVIIQSPDYRMSAGYPILEEGVEILVSTKKADNFTSARESFEANPLAVEIAENVKDVEVDSRPALSYEYSYEGVNATMVDVLDNGLMYSIRFRYLDDTQKETHQETFDKVLESFSFK